MCGHQSDGRAIDVPEIRLDHADTRSTPTSRGECRWEKVCVRVMVQMCGTNTPPTTSTSLMPTYPRVLDCPLSLTTAGATARPTTAATPPRATSEVASAGLAACHRGGPRRPGAIIPIHAWTWKGSKPVTFANLRAGRQQWAGGIRPSPGGRAPHGTLTAAAAAVAPPPLYIYSCEERPKSARGRRRPPL